MAQWKPAEPITQRSIERTYLLLKQNLYMHTFKSKIPWYFLNHKTLSHWNRKQNATQHEILFQFESQTARKTSADEYQKLNDFRVKYWRQRFLIEKKNNVLQPLSRLRIHKNWRNLEKKQSSKKTYKKINETKLRVRFDCTSRMAQRKTASYYLLLKENLHVHKLKSNIPWDFFENQTLCLIQTWKKNATQNKIKFHWKARQQENFMQTICRPISNIHYILG